MRSCGAAINQLALIFWNCNHPRGKYNVSQIEWYFASNDSRQEASCVCDICVSPAGDGVVFLTELLMLTEN